MIEALQYVENHLFEVSCSHLYSLLRYSRKEY